jgi:hypothetical protein
MPKFHLVKRNPKKNGVGHKRRNGTVWFVNTSINQSPAGSLAQEGDTLYVYETGYAVWAKGRIKEVRKHELRGIENILSYATSLDDDGAQFRESKFWGPEILDKIWPRLRKAGDLRVHVLEVSADLEVLEIPIFPKLETVGGQVSWRYLKEPPASVSNELMVSPKIPSSLRYHLYQTFNLHGQQYYIDIDHFVPKSVGGPGNIEENLVPVGLNINRRMSNDVPSAVFSVAHRRGYPVDEQLALGEAPVMLSDLHSKDQATKLLHEIVNKKKLEEVRSFYRDVRKVHLPKFDFAGWSAPK